MVAQVRQTVARIAVPRHVALHALLFQTGAFRPTTQFELAEKDRLALMYSRRGLSFKSGKGAYPDNVPAGTIRQIAVNDNRQKARSKRGWTAPTPAQKAKVKLAELTAQRIKSEAEAKTERLRESGLYHDFLGEREHSREFLAVFKELRRDFHGDVTTAKQALEEYNAKKAALRATIDNIRDAIREHTAAKTEVPADLIQEQEAAMQAMNALTASDPVPEIPTWANWLAQYVEAAY
jgi:hypothetical protein